MIFLTHFIQTHVCDRKNTIHNKILSFIILSCFPTKLSLSKVLWLRFLYLAIYRPNFSSLTFSYLFKKVIAYFSHFLFLISSGWKVDGAKNTRIIFFKCFVILIFLVGERGISKEFIVFMMINNILMNNYFFLWKVHIKNYFTCL